MSSYGRYMSALAVFAKALRAAEANIPYLRKVWLARAALLNIDGDRYSGHKVTAGDLLPDAEIARRQNIALVALTRQLIVRGFRVVGVVLLGELLNVSYRGVEKLSTYKDGRVIDAPGGAVDQM